MGHLRRAEECSVVIAGGREDGLKQRCVGFLSWVVIMALETYQLGLLPEVWLIGGDRSKGSVI